MELCEFCLLARIDPDLRERLNLLRLNVGDEIILKDVLDCFDLDHDGVMADARQALRNVHLVARET